MRTPKLVLTLVLAMTLAGCEALCAPGCAAREHHSSSSLVDFQYPAGQLRAGHANVQLVHKDGSTGGAGAFSWGWLVVLLPLVVWRARRRAALGDDQDAGIRVPDARLAARGPEVSSGMRLPRIPRNARPIPMRAPRLSMRN